MTTSDILLKAAARVRQGWCRFYRHNNGGVCALGAFDDMTLHFGGAEHDQVTRPAVAALAALLPVTSAERKVADADLALAWRVADWNNAPSQTAENVAATMEYAALLEDEKLKAAAITRDELYERGELTAAAGQKG